MNAVRTAAAIHMLVAGGCLLVAGVAPVRAQEPASGSFVEVAWPFHIDQWGTGRAFRCDAAHCGAAIDVYLRAKVGFCNCTKGVADDDEIMRVGDIELIEGTAIALVPGRTASAGFLHGRAQPFRVGYWFAPARFVLEIALNNKCDAVVATAVAATPFDESRAASVLAFLSGPDVQRWAADNTGSETQ